ncbi:chaperone ATPase hsp78 [Maudiozyma exigua]|uniref:Chaperone ATPase hsp78 n=1 Tax=Maudiozyma exigua TaxID=34358 RepID=A0A9P6W9A3_MAUEX|nr:chaperone ATPase hsp78 [Kazachstania exigua]
MLRTANLQIARSHNLCARSALSGLRSPTATLSHFNAIRNDVKGTLPLLRQQPVRNYYGSRPIVLPQQRFNKFTISHISMRPYVQIRTDPNKKSFLDQYAVNLTSLAKEGKLDPIIGRDEEISRAIQILSRRTKNNPVVIGRAGVGKTSLVEGLAQRIVRDEVPESLRGKQLYNLELSSLVAGAKYKGEFEERLKGVLDDIDDTVIIFIDEVHMLLGLGGSGQGSMDASNILKPKLAKGLRCISATTLDEYKIIEKDPALARRFQPIILSEPTVADTISILRGLKERYEVHHGVRITDAALVSAAVLSNRYINDRFLPDKAIDLVDEACAVLRLQHESKPDEIQILDRHIMRIQIELESLKKETDPVSIERRESLQKELDSDNEELSRLTKIWDAEKQEIDSIKNAKANLEKAKIELEQTQRTGDYRKASELRFSVIPDLQKKIELANKKDSNGNAVTETMLHDSVTSDDISKVVARMTGIPTETVLKGDKDRLLFMEDSLKERVVGQDQAIKAIAEAVRLQRAGLTSEKRPIASFMFLGPTGTGKTELTKALAQFLFDNESNVIRFDMSEFQEKHTVSRLIGAPPGYVLSESGGQLTEAVRRNPYAVVLFDEFEKAHPDVSKLLLQVLDEGKLTDSLGHPVDFRNTIIVMSSNIGQDILLSEKPSKAEEDSGNISSEIKQRVIDEMKRHYPPEFINRIDDILVFNRLSKTVLRSIVDIRIKEIQERLNEKRLKLNLSLEAKDWLTDHGYDHFYGARPLNRLIHKEILNSMATYLLKGQLRNGETVNVVVDGKKLVVEPNHAEGEEVEPEPEK